MRKLTALMLALLLLLSGCAASSPAPQSAASREDLTTQSEASDEDLVTKAETAEDASSATLQTETQDPAELVQTAISESGDYTDSIGNGYHYSYRVPVLTPDTEGAREINVEILSRFGELVQTEKKEMEEGCSLSVGNIDFEEHLWQNVLSLVVTVYYDFDYTDYCVYCYETDTGSRLSTRQLLEKRGIGEEAFLESVRTEALRIFEENYAGILDRTDEESLRSARELTVSEECVNLDMMVYPGEDGRLRVIAPIGSLAGPAWYYQTLTIE